VALLRSQLPSSAYAYRHDSCSLAEKLPHVLNGRLAALGGKAHGGEMVTLPPDETKELMAKISSVGDDIVKDKPDMKPLWDMLVGISKR
jgi:hypothetical protein